MQFEIYGPFDLAVAPNGLIDASNAAKRAFSETLEAKERGLSSACGCYAFTVKANNGSLPWYIGRTTKRTFKDECLGSHQVNYYNQPIAKKKRIAPQLFLLAKLTPSNRFAKPTKNKHFDIEFLESYLIARALNRNRGLLNQKQTKFLKAMSVPGILNSTIGAPALSVRELKEVLGL